MNEVSMYADSTHEKLLLSGSRFYSGFFLPILITLLFTLCTGEAAMAQCSSPPQYNIYLDHPMWSIPGSAFSNYTITELIGDSVDIYPNVGVLMNDVVIENGTVTLQPKPICM